MADPCVVVTAGDCLGRLVLAYFLGVAMGVVAAWWLGWWPGRKAVCS